MKTRKNAISKTIESNAAAILSLIAAKPEMSYEDMSATLMIDRRAAIVAVKRLEALGRLRVRRSKGGGKPNRYECVA